MTNIPAPRGPCGGRADRAASAASQTTPCLARGEEPLMPSLHNLQRPRGPYGGRADRDRRAAAPCGAAGAATQLREATQLQLRGDVATAVLSGPCGSPYRAEWASLLAACLQLAASLTASSTHCARADRCWRPRGQVLATARTVPPVARAADRRPNHSGRCRSAGRARLLAACRRALRAREEPRDAVDRVVSAAADDGAATTPQGLLSRCILAAHAVRGEPCTRGQAPATARTVPPVALVPAT